MRELLDELAVGTRTISHIEWPVVDQLWRTGPRTWEIVRELCNGYPRGVEVYRSEATAREAFGGRIDGRKPRTGEPANERIGLRLTDREKAAWSAAAERAGVSISDWLRALAEQAIAGIPPGNTRGNSQP